MENKSEIIVGLIAIWLVTAWITHIIVCFKTTSWGFLIAGALFFPIAWVHGTGIWFEWW
ncbi:TPA: hypothetical protein PXS19_002472 [Yersinia enterocolitica]|uniref:hypothetical protein n=1 Tax=Yersinia enterocolitica TaxID=630 RepID=UPI000501A5F8|nr:hypothetical protein [Yersinia enterocolitica]KGA78057.1 putative membrane protein [Yersinia enterocolitica]HDL7612540.1 hypothetical protein [Yersinia enterocolitica]HDL7641195.1 hypothetical protein [Yersinia enterocolitica]HDL7691829.1 hypothetical protein [Yersinia enterocolitica]HDL7757312.1 hypothetical protein [Yersinia enterocolitica]